MPEAYIVDAVRTAVGKRGGTLSQIHPADLGGHTLKALMDRTGLDPNAVDDVVMGCIDTIGPQAGDIARTAWLTAGLPEHVPGVTVDRQCGSSQQAVHFAAQAVMSGTSDVESHRRAIRPRDGGRFETQIVALNGLVHDEGIREPNPEKIKSLPTLSPGGRLAAAVASQISDAIAAMLVVSEKALKEQNLKPRARIHHLSVRATDPIMM